MEKKNSDKRLKIKYVHVTIHKVGNLSLDYWISKGMSFRPNVLACLVGMEKNYEEGKGLHVHIVIQFSTRQDITRSQFVEHFGSDSVHISVPGRQKKDLLNMLGYASKADNHGGKGTFTYRGNVLDSNPEVWRFHYQVKTIDDGIAYFHKVIREHIKDENIIDKYSEREDAIGIWLQKNSSHARTLRKLAHTWNLNYRNSRKKGFEFNEWVYNSDALQHQYESYLYQFPDIFEKHKPSDSKRFIESDYAFHAEHDLANLGLIVRRLDEAMRFGPNRPHKTLNLYIWSLAPAFGKTRLLNFLDSHLMAYRLPDDQYYVDYKNGIYSILVSDEAAVFLKTKSYSHLKSIFEGESVEFNLKGKTKIYKRDNPLVVLAENESFDELMGRYYPERYTKKVMEDRLLDLELKSRATLHFLIDRCVKRENIDKSKLPLFFND